VVSHPPGSVLGHPASSLAAGIRGHSRVVLVVSPGESESEDQGDASPGFSRSHRMTKRWRDASMM
jgi:hypothetical protein